MRGQYVLVLGKHLTNWKWSFRIHLACWAYGNIYLSWLLWCKYR